jgi:hypothetical protein
MFYKVWKPTILLSDACVELIAEEENRSWLDDEHKGLSGIRIEHGWLQIFEMSKDQQSHSYV